MRFLSKLWLYCLFLLSASAVSNGNIPACSVDMSIGAGTAIMKWVQAPVSSSMYTITAPATTYVPGELTPITVTVTDLDYVYIGMLLVAVLNNGTNVGKWSVMDGDDFFLPSTCKFQAVVHASAELKPINQTFFWKSDANVGPVKFRALIKQGEQAHGNFYKPADLTLTPSSAVPTTQTVFKGDVGESCNEVCGQKGMACDDTGTLGLNTPAILQSQVSKFYPCQEPYLKACAPPGTGANSYCFSYNCLASQTFNLASTCSYRSADPLMNQRFCKCKAGTVVRDPTKPASDASSTIGMHLDDPVQMDELTLNSLEITSTDVTVDVTGPQDRWFAIGWDAAYMSGTYATVVWLNNASVGIPQNYDLIADKGYADGVTGWYDINCRQALVDFCRNVGPNTNKYFSCAMANTTAGTTMRDVYLANTSSRVPCKNSHIAPFLPMTVAEYVLSDSPRNGTKLPSSITIKSSGVVGGRFNIVFSRPLTGARAFPNKNSMNLIWAIGVTQYFGVSNGAFNKHSKKSESVVPISLTPIYATCPPSPPTAPTAPTTKRPTSPTTKTPTAATPTAAPPTTAPTTPPTTKAPTAPTSPTAPTAPTAKPTTKAPATKAPTARAPTAPTAKPTTKVPTAPTAPTAPTMPTSVPTGSPTVFVPPTPEEMLSPALNRLPSLWVLPALAAMGSKNWLCGALLAVLLRPVSAHNWMNSPSRAQVAAVSIPCQKRVDPAPHLQVIPGQKFQLEWSTGHGDTTTVYTYFVFVKEEDYDKLALLQDPMMDEYLSKAPAASLLTGDQWTKRHLSPWSAYYTGCTDCNNGNNNPGTFASVINPGNARYIARNNIAVQKSLKKGDVNVTQFWYNLGDLAGDMRAEYKSEKYPWMLSVHRFRIAAHWPSEYDMATFAFPTNLTAGNYIAHFKWGGYRDCTDVHIILNLNPVAALWGSLGNVTGSFTRLDHCEFTFVLNPLVGCQKITAGNASQCIASCLITENCVAVQAVRKTNPAGTMPYTPNFPYKNYTRNDSAINVFPPPEYGPCDSRTIHKRRNCPAITPKCNDAALNPIAADEYLCYGINPYRDQDFQTVDDYVISTDPQDPGFYSTCWVRLAPGGFTYPYPQPATPPPVWKVGKKCLSCDWLKNTYAGLSDKTAPDWTQAFSTDCRDCDISATQCATDLKPEISFGNAGNCTGTLSSNQVCNAQCDSGFTLFGAPRVCQNGLLTGGNQECVFGGCP